MSKKRMEATLIIHNLIVNMSFKVIIQSSDGNTLLLLLQRQWAARLKIRHFLSAGSFQSCINNQENVGLEGALLLTPRGL